MATFGQFLQQPSQAGYSQGSWSSPQMFGVGIGGQPSMGFGVQSIGTSPLGAQAANPLDALALDIADDLSGELVNRIVMAMQLNGVAPQGWFGDAWKWVKTKGKEAAGVVVRETVKAVIGALAQPQAQSQALGVQSIGTSPYGAQAANPLDALALDIADDFSGELANRIVMAMQLSGVAPQGWLGDAWKWAKGKAKDVAKVAVREGVKMVVGALTQQQAQPLGGFQVQSFGNQPPYSYGGYSGAQTWQSSYPRW